MSNGNISETAIRLRKHEHLENDLGYDECSHLSADQQDDNNLDGNYDYCQSTELPPPPDGGYGWVICFASFMCNMIVDGIAYTFGIFLSEFVQYFDEGKGKVAWVGSLLSGVYLSAGPIVSALANKYGCRTVCIVGSVVGCVAFVLSTFSTSVNILMISYGVIGGFGFGLIYLPAVVAVGYYFETKRSLATGIAVCGSGFGTFAFAPLATFLLQRYGWKNALLIFAGLILNCAIFGALMRPLTYPKKKHSKPLMQRMYEEKQLQLERGSIGGSHIMVQLPDSMANERKMRVLLNADPGVHSSVNLELLAQQQQQQSSGILQPVSTLPTITEVRLINQQAEGTNNLQQIEEGGGGGGEVGGGEGGGGGSGKRNSKRENCNIESTTATFDIIRNSSQPAFNIDHQVLPKNGSVPSFSRFRKTSAHERFQPSLAAIRASSRGEMDADLGDMNLATSKASLFQRQNSKMVRPMSRKDIFYSGSVTNLPQYQSQKSLTNYRNSVLSLTKYEKSALNLRTTLEPPPGPLNGSSLTGGGGGAGKRRRGNYLCSCFALPNSIKSVFSTMLDVSLLKDPVFMLIGISNVFGMAGLYVPFVYLVDAAKMAGIEDNSASFLLSIIGITNTIGRVMCGYVADFPQVDSLLLNNVCLLISTVAVSLTPICTVYSAFVTMSIFFGIAISGYISLTSIILVDLLGLDKLTNAFGLLILFRGFAAIMGSPLAGAVYDATQSYDLPFYMAGALFALSTITSFIAPCLKHCTPPHERPIHIEALTPINEEQSEILDDDDDQPITMVPKIVQTLPSPQQEVYAKDFNEKEMPTTSAAFTESRL